VTGILDGCYADRFDPLYTKPHSLFHAVLPVTFGVGVILLLLYAYGSMNWVFFFASFAGLLLYLVMYALLAGLKELLRDTTCSAHGNSVSGHYSAHIYFIFTLFYLQNFTSLKLKTGRTILQTVAVILYLLVVLLSAVTLVNTVMGGFHSLRQVYYGIFFGLIQFMILTSVLDGFKRLPAEDIRDVPSVWAYIDALRGQLIFTLIPVNILAWGFVYSFLGKFRGYHLIEFSGVGVLWVFLIGIHVYQHNTSKPGVKSNKPDLVANA